LRLRRAGLRASDILMNAPRRGGHGLRSTCTQAKCMNDVHKRRSIRIYKTAFLVAQQFRRIRVLESQNSLWIWPRRVMICNTFLSAGENNELG
jgi:hypothetical protein